MTSNAPTSGTVTGTTLTGEAAKPGYGVVIKQNGTTVGQGTMQGDGSVNVGGTIYRPTNS